MDSGFAGKSPRPGMTRIEQSVPHPGRPVIGGLGVNKNPGLSAGVRKGPSWEERARRLRGTLRSAASRWNLGFVLGRLAQHVAAAPDRLDVVLAARGVGELLAELADE